MAPYNIFSEEEKKIWRWLIKGSETPHSGGQWSCTAVFGIDTYHRFALISPVLDSIFMYVVLVSKVTIDLGK